MNMNIETYISQMAQQAQSIASLAVGISEEQARWKPDLDSWSILEVVNHLYDEEQFDFRVRLDILLNDPGRDWPPIDPQGWVTSRNYNQRDPKESLENFLGEREKSLAWLRGLEEPDLDRFVRSQFGRMAAGDMFFAWVTHDLLHLRQLVELRYAWTQQQAEPYGVGYAGDW
jgi:hypothetical protein